MCMYVHIRLYTHTHKISVHLFVHACMHIVLGIEPEPQTYQGSHFLSKVPGPSFIFKTISRVLMCVLITHLLFSCKCTKLYHISLCVH